MTKSLNMENAPISKLFLTYFIPAVTGMLMMSLNIVIDGIFIGRGVGSNGLASINIIFPIFMLFLAIGLCIGIGGSTIISINFGEKKYQDAQDIFGQSMTLSIIISIVIIVLGNLYLDELAYFLGASTKIVGYVKDYLFILLNFSWAYIIGDALNCFVRNDSNPRLAMYSMVIGALVNCVLDYIFIFKFHWSLKGAALATGIAEIILVLILFYHFIGRIGELRFRISKLILNDVIRILRSGIPTFITEISTGAVALLFNLVLMSLIREIGVSAYSIINYVHALVIMIFVGISQAIQPIISYNYGAKKEERVKQINKLGIKVSLILGVSFFVIGIFFGQNIVKLFNKNDLQLIELTTGAMKLYFIAYLFMGSNIVIATYFQSIEKVRISTTISMLRSFFFVVIGLYILSKMFHVTGVWLAIPCAEFLTLLVSCYFLKFNKENGNT